MQVYNSNNDNRDIVKNDYDSALKANREAYYCGDIRAGIEYIYDNQKLDALRIVNKFYDTDVRVISIVKRTKVGMDGLMIEIAKNMSTHIDDDFMVHRSNIFFITAMSNVAWERDMKNKMPSCFRNNVYHHGKLHNLKSRLKNIENALLINDEIDTGDKVGQKLHKVLKNSGLLDILYMEQKNIRFVFVSATMVNELRAFYKWGDKHFNYRMTVPDTYIGHIDFLDMDIIKEFYAINDKKSAERWVQEDILLNYGIDYRVHIIRTDGKNINFISGVCKSYDIDFYEHTSVDRIEHDELVRIFGNLKINRKHIIIAVKGFYRRANLIPNEWKMKIGATHEKYVENFDTNVQVQGLPGRMTGYWRDIILSGHKTGPHRTSIRAINEYEMFYRNPDRVISREERYHSRVSGGVFMDPQHIKNLEECKLEEYVDPCMRVPVIIGDLCKDDEIFTTTERGRSVTSLRINYLKSKICGDMRYKELYDYICGSGVKCYQTTRPSTDKSYKKHVTDVVNASISGRPFSVDLHESWKSRNNWQLIVDDREYRICIVIWCVDGTY